MDAEGLALQQGMNMAKDLKLEKVIFEIDCSKIAEILWFGTASTYSTQDTWRDSYIEDLSTHMEWQVRLINKA